MRTHTRLTRARGWAPLFIAVATLGSACGSGLGSPTGPILGTWERKNNDGSVRDRWVFKADGTFTFDEISNPPSQQDHVSGRFGVGGDYINGQGTNSRDNKSATMRASYFANTNRMCIGALLRQGSGTGVVGTWYGEQSGVGGDGAQLSLTIRVEARADRTATVTTTGSENATRSATWEEQSAGVYKVRFGTGNVTLSMTFTLFDDRALCNTPYEKAS